MTDISLAFDSNLNVFDAQIADARVVVGDELHTAVLISLFTWRRAEPGDVQEGEAKFGWWGDTFNLDVNDRIGSRLWLLRRAKLTSETARRAGEYAREALQWFLDDGVATAIDVVSERVGISQLCLTIRISRSDAEDLDLTFDRIWETIND